MEMNLTVIEKDNGMVELRKENGDTLVMKKDIYELTSNLLGLFKKTDPTIIRAAVHEISPEEVENNNSSKKIHTLMGKYLELYHLELASNTTFNAAG
jgi:hypothetical protein